MLICSSNGSQPAGLLLLFGEDWHLKMKVSSMFPHNLINFISSLWWDADEYEYTYVVLALSIKPYTVNKLDSAKNGSIGR